MWKKKTLLAACLMLAGNSLQAQFGNYPPPWYTPINPPPTDDCPGQYQSSYTVINPATGTPWFEAPSSGVAFFEDASTYTNVARVVVLRKRDLKDWCELDRVPVYVHAGDEYKVIFYHAGTLPTEPKLLQIHWPIVLLEIVSLKEETDTPSQIVQRVWVTETNQQFQLWYSQNLEAGWIPHQSFYGRFAPFDITNVAHVTTNRPRGFWRLKVGTPVAAHTNMNAEDVDPPIGYPPVNTNATPCEWPDCPPGP